MMSYLSLYTQHITATCNQYNKIVNEIFTFFFPHESLGIGVYLVLPAHLNQHSANFRPQRLLCGTAQLYPTAGQALPRKLFVTPAAMRLTKASLEPQNSLGSGNMRAKATRALILPVVSSVDFFTRTFFTTKT
ncbi:hypothetical protein mRhiFer1_009468 [Rhinolophus ferrumequinum]|uniref:Uncharacterized protein n=1 Tax=Rhinolophus ferrumequinum TaxID=59479 RepID=A0A7J7REQ3_RHIFE|nr:hypothetical protein mRhiFer1_009468 [Rhinolophus ferrumequinum]